MSESGHRGFRRAGEGVVKLVTTLPTATPKVCAYRATLLEKNWAKALFNKMTICGQVLCFDDDKCDLAKRQKALFSTFLSTCAHRCSVSYSIYERYVDFDGFCLLD